MHGPMKTPRRDFLKSAGLGLAAGGPGFTTSLAQAAEVATAAIRWRLVARIIRREPSN